MSGVTTATALTLTLAAVSTAVGVAGAAAQAAGQQAQANQVAARNQIQQNLVAQNRANQMQQGQQQIVYKNDEAFQQLETSAMSKRSAEATAMASAGDNGVNGVSVGALAQEYDARQGEFASDVTYNRDAATSQIQLQMQGFNTQAESADNQLPIPNYPSMINTGLQIGGSALGAYNKYIAPGNTGGDNGYTPPLNQNPTYPSRTYDPPGGY